LEKMAAMLKIHVASTFFLQSDPEGTFVPNFMLVSPFERFCQKNHTYLLHYGGIEKQHFRVNFMDHVLERAKLCKEANGAICRTLFFTINLKKKTTNSMN